MGQHATTEDPETRRLHHPCQLLSSCFPWGHEARGAGGAWEHPALLRKVSTRYSPPTTRGQAAGYSTRPAPVPGPVPTQEGSACCWRTDNETCLYVRSDPILQEQNMTPTEGQPGIPTPPERRTGAPGRGKRSQLTPP